MSLTSRNLRWWVMSESTDAPRLSAATPFFLSAQSGTSYLSARGSCRGSPRPRMNAQATQEGLFPPATLRDPRRSSRERKSRLGGGDSTVWGRRRGIRSTTILILWRLFSSTAASYTTVRPNRWGSVGESELRRPLWTATGRRHQRV